MKSRVFVAAGVTCRSSEKFQIVLYLCSLNSYKMSVFELSEQELQRRETLQKIREYGIDPYPAALYPVTDFTADIKASFIEGKQVCLAGRMMSQRVMGKASFAELQDSTGRLQVYFNRDEICPGEDKSLYNDVFKRFLDLGDFIGIKGEVFKTQVGEISVNVKEFTLLSKSLKPLPLPKTDAEGKVHDAFTDPEQRYRQRYADLAVNPHVKDVFVKRTKLFNAMRSFFNPLYMRIANELYLKRLIVGGFDGVYEFSKNFRNEGMDRTHNPEFTAMEIYVAYKDYNWMMDFTERLLENCALAVNGRTKTTFGEHQIDFKAPYKRITMRDAILEFTGFDISGKTEGELFEAAKGMGLDVDNTMGKGKLIDEIFGAKCEGNYIQPTFITDYPKEMSPLCKTHRNDPELTERFELMVCGKEIANAYSELNDPIDQRERFEEQLKLSERGDDEAMFIDQDFLRALEYGMPPTSGLGVGMDRLIMYLTNNPSIQEVLFFPQMRPEVKSHKLELNDNEKMIFEMVQNEGSIDLGTLKLKAGLSGKQWDVSMKSLTKQGILKVTKTDDQLTVALAD